MSVAIELRQVSKVHGAGLPEVHALREVDLPVERGELVVDKTASPSDPGSLLASGAQQ